MQAEQQQAPAATGLVRRVFVKVGVLPFFLVAALVLFSALSSRFLTVENLVNVARQSVYLVLVSLGQMLALISGGFDLSVGTAIAVTSVVAALAMATFAVAMPIWAAIVLGCLVGLAAAFLIGLLNGIGIAYFEVSPFIMTLGVSSVGAGLALFHTGGSAGVRSSGGVWRCLRVRSAVGRSRAGGHRADLYRGDVAGDGADELRHADLRRRRQYQGRPSVRDQHGAHAAACLYLLRPDRGADGASADRAGGSSDATLGGTTALESIAACIIAGVSLRGGIGRVENVVLGAFFIVLVQNGMNLAQISSYMQMVLLGLLLILAVILDQVRYRMIMSGK